MQDFTKPIVNTQITIEPLKNMYYHTIIDSHYWTSIEMLLNFLKTKMNLISTEYLIKGLENTLKAGYDIKK